MLDTEEKQVLDQAHKDEDLRELLEQKDADGQLGPLERKFIDDFYAVTSSMEKALRDVPDVHFSQELDTPEYYALKSLYMAKTGRTIDTGEYISGLERSHLLNQALIYLQPVLAIALRPDFREGRNIYDKLAVQVSQVSQDIKSAINKEAVPPQRRKLEEKTEEADTDDDDDDDDDADADAPADDADAADAADEQSDEGKGRKRSIWSRLTGKKSGEADGESGET